MISELEVKRWRTMNPKRTMIARPVLAQDEEDDDLELLEELDDL